MYKLQINESIMAPNHPTLYHSVFNQRSLDFVLDNGIVTDDA